MPSTQPPIILKNVRVHNLKGVNLTLEHHQLIVFTGVSGSGKSSLAFDTIYVEGQRRYVESLSTYARRQIGDLPKPDAESISGISPTIAIEQKTAGRNPRSTVGTMTNIYDFLRVLYARIGIPHCPISGEPVRPLSAAQIFEMIWALGEGTKVILLSPHSKGKKGAFKEEFLGLIRKGFMRIRLDGNIVDLSEEISVNPSVAHDIDLVIDRLVIAEAERKRLLEAVSKGLELGEGILKVLEGEREHLFSLHAFAAGSQMSYGPLEPSDFSFNHPSGMCPTCQGLGKLQEFAIDLVIDPELSIAEDCCKVASPYETVRYGNIFDNLAKLYNFKVTTPWKKLSDEARHVFLYGTKKKWTTMQFVHPVKQTRWTEYVQWRGVLTEARERFEAATSDLYRKKMETLMEESVCPSCKGERLQPYPAATLLGKKRIAELCSLPVNDLVTFFQKLSLSEGELKIGGELIKEIRERLSFLKGVGLDYLSLERTAPTLSGGEAQRVRLASQIGSGLVGATYVLDEPSIGLHPVDNTKLLATLKRLRDAGNTVIVVEHDEETIRSADWVVDFGPLAGEKGGEILSSGPLETLLGTTRSITADYLLGKKKMPASKKRKPTGFLQIQKATHHNLQNIDVSIPLGVLVAITGVSGSGKSSLITDILFPVLSNHLQRSSLKVGKHKKVVGMDLLKKVIAIDQTPIGRTPRSNAATYIKLFDEIRDLFCQLPESVAQGFKPGRFSFNVKEGSCPHCSGMGMTKIDMDFMEDEWVNCQHCDGKRFDENTLSVLYRGKNIYEILKMTVVEAAQFFQAVPSIHHKLETLLQVGLDYLCIGQPSPTLSGGEAQRIKLAKELCRPSGEKTLYILDEPTTGLHFHDVRALLIVLQDLVSSGHSVIVIEHNVDLIRSADYIIELGPEGGSRGGLVVAKGTPAMVAKSATPTAKALTWKFAKETLPTKRAPPLASIRVEGAWQNNLKGVSATIPRGQITLCTGPSGSGKSSFAFDTLYAEGQRRYIESLPAYLRQFVKQSSKPKVDFIEGLSPAIAIEQKSSQGNPRSTIGTLTETYDFLKVLYAHLGIAYCPETGEQIRTISKQFVVNQLLELPEHTRVHILSPILLKKAEEFATVQERLRKLGYLRLRLNGTEYELDTEIPFDRSRKNELFLVIDRLLIQEKDRNRLFAAVDQAATLSHGTLVAAHAGGDLFFNLSFTAVGSGKSYSPITPHTFSFNTEEGMCPQCQGLGFQYGANFFRFPEILRLNTKELLTLLWKDKGHREAMRLSLSCLEQAGIDGDVPLADLEASQMQFLLKGSDEIPLVSKGGVRYRWRGLNDVFENLCKLPRGTLRDQILPLLEEIPCPACQGARLNPLARNVRIQGVSITDLCHQSIEDAATFLHSLQLSEETKFLEETLRQLNERLRFLLDVGLGYLSLDRSAPSLSGGETQRIRLARQLGAGLTGTLYVLDEPTIGLHPHDTERLNLALQRLRSLGNTLLLVEHDPMTLKIADYILDFGPQAGRLGGEITARGTLEEIIANPLSLTGNYLSGRKTIPVSDKHRAPKTHLILENGNVHNLKNITVQIPIQALTCITGVSGSGKSTLMHDLLRPAMEKALARRRHTIDPISLDGATLHGTSHFDKLLVLDQNPVGHTNRADVSTYTDLFTALRFFFAQLPEAKMRGLSPKNFSFNHVKGMCSLCTGLGYRSISMQFLPPVKVPCESCKGFRLNPLSLQVSLKGRHLGHILQMTVEEAKEFLPLIPKITRILDTLTAVGLSYLLLGQEIATLSGGEAQRLRLSTELAKRNSGNTLYMFDEPTIGLHNEDIAKLLPILHTLVDQGNTVILIEHNIAIIQAADYLIDMGPGSGSEGGSVVATGTPSQVARNPHSLTGKYL